MRALIFHCRGAGNRNFERNIRDLIAQHNPSIILLVETRVTGSKQGWCDCIVAYTKFMRCAVFMAWLHFKGGLFGTSAHLLHPITDCMKKVSMDGRSRSKFPAFKKFRDVSDSLRPPTGKTPRKGKATAIRSTETDRAAGKLLQVNWLAYTKEPLRFALFESLRPSKQGNLIRVKSQGQARKPGSFTNPSSVIPAIGSSALK